MSKTLHKGDTVEWQWGNGSATGTIQQKFEERVSRTFKGTEVVRDADSENPAFLIRQDDGSEVLKSASELTRL